MEAVSDRARELWVQVAGSGARFAFDVSVTVAPESRLCPAGWAGIVVIDGKVLATAPDEGAARLMEEALGGLGAETLTSAEVLRRRLAVGDIRGPATLAYLDAGDFRPTAGVVEALEPGDHGVRQFRAGTAPDDLEESGIEEISTPAFVVREGGQVVAAAGYRDWPGDTAHLSVLTAPAARGRGLARRAASAAVGHALAEGKLPQWRARVEASRRVARALGFRELGAQVSLRLT